MKRRSFIKTSLAAAVATSAASRLGKSLPHQFGANIHRQNSDITVIGAGVMGVWTAFYLQQMGAKVTLIDAYGPGNSRSSSGGETRILRSDYGDRMLYSKMNIRAHDLWSKWQHEWGSSFLYSTGRLTIGEESFTSSAHQTKERLGPLGITSEVLSAQEMRYRWPQIVTEEGEIGLFFPGGAGGSTLMARESCRIVGEKFVEAGGTLKIAHVEPQRSASGNIDGITLNTGEEILSDKILFACGPWMTKIFPEVFSERLKVYRRDVLFVGIASGDDRYSYPNFPVWSFLKQIDGRHYYGMPDIRGRGLKVAPWPDMNSIDVDFDERMINTYEIKRVRNFVATRMPGLKNQPVLEGRVCQLTMSADSHFIIDKHPENQNIWFVCAGSGHAFKHGPALGEYVSKRILEGDSLPEYDRAFSLK